MKKKTTILFSLLILALAFMMVFPVFAGTRPNYVYDNANLLSTEERDIIHTMAYEHDLNSTNEIVVYTMENLDE